MNAPSLEELKLVREVATTVTPWPGDYVVHWHSAFGLIIIEVKHGQVFVNGDHVQSNPVPPMGGRRVSIPAVRDEPICQVEFDGRPPKVAQ